MLVPPQQPANSYVPVTPTTAGRLRLMVLGCVELNLDGYQARVAGRVTQLPGKQFELLRQLMSNAGRVMTRRELLDTVWEPDYPDKNKTLNVHVLRLRNQLRAACSQQCGEIIRNVRGVGYMFEVPTWPDRPVETEEGAP